MRDPAFLADAKKTHLDIEPITEQGMEKIVARIFKLDPALAAKLKSILNPNSIVVVKTSGPEGAAI